MKKRSVLFNLALTALAASAQTEQTDTVASRQLQEVVVETEASIETGTKTILYPTKLQKRHSTNGYELLSNMNLPELEIDVPKRQIATLSGRNVIVLINGVEALPDELATLAASDIVKIDYQRSAGGRYAGQGSVVNFMTRQYDYGGNVYLSADRGFVHRYGNYLGMVNHKRKALTLSLTASGEWDRKEERNPEDNVFFFPQGTLSQKVSPVVGLTRKHSRYGRLKLVHAEHRHSFTAALSLVGNAIPERYQTDRTSYSGLYNFDAEVSRYSEEKALAPGLDIDYSLVLPHGHTIRAMIKSAFTHTRYHSSYEETGANRIVNDTKEDNTSVDVSLSYFKDLPRGMTAGVSLAKEYTGYHDVYTGSFAGTQDLTNNFLQIGAVFQQSLPCGLFYYANAGVSNLVSRISGITDNRWNPVAYLGAEYAVNQRHSLSFNGLYVHSIYDPSYKNDAVIRTSFFQATVGNPYLQPLKCLQNVLSYNGRIGYLRLSGSLASMKYFDNNAYRYFIEGDMVYKQFVNDGTFSWVKATLGVSFDLLDKRLNIGGNGLFARLCFDSYTRPEHTIIWRGSLNATLFLGDWRVKAIYAPQRRTMDWNGVHIIDPSQYGLTVNWNSGAWSVACSIDNFLKRFQGSKYHADYNCWLASGKTLADSMGRNISLKLTYTLSYGRKTDRENLEPRKTVNSAILRPF